MLVFNFWLFLKLKKPLKGIQIDDHYLLLKLIIKIDPKSSMYEFNEKLL